MTARRARARPGAAVLAVLLAAGSAHRAAAQGSAATSAAPSAARWSVRMAESVMRRHPVVSVRWDYTAGLVLLAIDRLARETGKARYATYVQENMDRFVAPDGSIRTYDAREHNLDQINQGRLLFPLYARTHDDRYRKAAVLLREQLREQPRTSEGGFWHKQIYPNQMWLDGLYMAEPFYAEFARTFGDTAAFSDIALQFLLAARHTRDARTGLFYHAWDATRQQPWADPNTGQSPNFWGRAVGWYLMGAIDVLDDFPATHPDRAALVAVVRDLAGAVAKVQDPVTGLWYQVLDQPSRAGNYLEASASSMFVYALAKGVRLGVLDPRFREVAERGYAGLVAHMVTVDADGLVSLHGICQVAGLGGKARRDGSFAYYVSEPVVTNDYKGVGAFILASLELGR